MSEFRIPERWVTLVLDDGDFAGAEIEANVRVPMAVLRDVIATSGMSLEDRFRAFGDLFIEWGRPTWNLADFKGPIPTDRDGWERLDAGTGTAISVAWMRGMVEPPAPLPQQPSGPTPSRQSRRHPSSTGRASATRSSSGIPATPSRRSSKRTRTS